MNITSKIDKNLQQKLIIFVAIVFFGLFFWLLTANVFVPQKVIISHDIRSLTAVILSPDLKTDIVLAMEEGRSFDQSELENFAIYLDDTAVSQKESGFFVKKMAAREPFDLGYYSISSATVSGVVELVN